MAVELWMGQEFEHAHEMRALRDVLKQLNEHFADSNELYLVLANFYCEGEELDLAVVKQRAIVVLELKECNAAIIGGFNGDWRIEGGGLLNAGRRNPFQQVRTYRYALSNFLKLHARDFLDRQKLGKLDFSHVTGRVVFSPTMSPDTEIEIAQKDRRWFGCIGLDQLWSELNDLRSNELNINHGEARRLAAQVLNLHRHDVSEYLGQGIPEESKEIPEVEIPPVAASVPSIVAPEPNKMVEIVKPGADYGRLTGSIAIDIINSLRRGTVPQTGLEYLAVGLDREIHVIANQLSHAATGRGDFKFIRGAYGAGKTFLGALTIEAALEQNFAVGYVVVSTDTPLYRLEAIYHRVMTNLRTRGVQQAAFKAILDRWVYQLEEKIIGLEGFAEDDPRLAERVEVEIESGLADVAHFHSAFSAAIRGYYQAQLEGDYPTAQGLLGWLSGEQQISAQVKRKVNIRGEIDNTIALGFLRAVNAIARKAGMAGVAIVFDEVETVQRLRGPEREKSLNALRQLVDAIDFGEFPYTYLMFTGTPGFYEDRQGVPALQPLHDRIKLDNPDDPYPNPELSQIILPRFDSSKLQAVAQKVMRIYEVAYGHVDRQRMSDIFLEYMIAEITNKFGGRVDVVPRQFVRALINELDKVRQYPEYNPDAEYEFSQSSVDIGLTPVEEEAIETVVF